MPAALPTAALTRLLKDSPRAVHIVAFRVIYTDSTLLLSGVFRRVVVDGESFMDTVFAAVDQGWGTWQRRLRVQGDARQNNGSMS